MWWLLWICLVLGTLLGAFFLLRDLWRKATSFLAEFSGFAQQLALLEQRAQQLHDSFDADPQLSNPFALNAAELRYLRTSRAARKLARHRRKLAKHAETYSTWQSYASLAGPTKR